MALDLDAIFSSASSPGFSGTIGMLRDNGYDFINRAENTFVNCLTKPGLDHVILVYSELDYTSDFYRMCRQRAGNPYLPVIHEIRDFDWGSVVRAERLVAMDHLEIDAQDLSLLKAEAPKFISYLRAEKPLLKETPLLQKTVQDILALSQHVYEKTDRVVLPYCDPKPTNIFLRKSPDGNQLVLGDPLFPGSGRREENLAAMNEIYRHFGLPQLSPPRPPAPQPPHI